MGIRKKTLITLIVLALVIAAAGVGIGYAAGRAGRTTETAAPTEEGNQAGYPAETVSAGEETAAADDGESAAAGQSAATESSVNAADESESGAEAPEETINPAAQANTEVAAEPPAADEPAADSEGSPAPAETAQAGTASVGTAPAGTPNAAAIRAESGSALAAHGRLSVRGTQLVDKNGAAYQLRGVSTHGLGWFPEYVNRAGFQTLRDEWGVNCVRLAMYTAEYNGYCSGGDQTYLKNLISNGVTYATELGMYVIIDWHILNDNNPNTNKAAAIDFFREMSAKYAGYDNVLYEICNEPNGGTTWQQIKSYAEEVIPVIRANAPNAIIIVGTPTWSQDVDQAAANPIRGYDNIMYTLHFYAATHKDSLRQKMTAAIASGLPVFCTEFGTCDASGNGGNDFAEAERWIATMDASGVSYCIWNLSNKSETSALIRSSCNKVAGWSESELSAAGQWYVRILGNGVTLGTVVTAAESSGDNSGSSGGGSAPTPTDAVTATADHTEVTVSNSGSWSTGTESCYQYTITLRNTGDAPITGWSVAADFGTQIRLDQSWSGSFSLSGSTVSITAVDYNATIPAGQSVELGFIIAASGDLEAPRVTLR